MDCSVCGLTIEGKYYEDLWNRVYCYQDYHKFSHHCSNCGAPLSEKIVRFDEQETFCERCVKAAPEKLSEIKKIYRRAKDILADLGFEIPGQKVDIEKRYHGTKGSAELKWKSSIDGDAEKSYKIQIRVGGFTNTSIFSALSHEIGHIFIYTHSQLKEGKKHKNLCPPTVTFELGEGFSNYLSLVALRRVEKGFLRPSFKKSEISSLYKDKYVQAIDRFTKKNGLDELRKRIIEECQNESLLLLPVNGKDEEEYQDEIKVSWRHVGES